MAVIATNTAANTATLFLNRNAALQGDSIAKISSGSRIVRASDDAASLAVGTALKADVSVLKQAAINSQNSVSVLSVADGGLSQINDILQRQKTLASQSASATVTDTERGFIDTEFQSLSAEINAIETAVTFNGDALLDGGFNQNTLVGTAGADLIALDLSSVNVDTTTLGTNNDNVATNGAAVTALTEVYNAITHVMNFFSIVAF